MPNHIDAYRAKTMEHVRKIWDRWRHTNKKNHIRQMEYLRKGVVMLPKLDEPEKKGAKKK